MEQTDTSPIRRAVAAVTTQSALAREINVAQAVVWQWVRGVRPVPARHCIAIETATRGAVTRYDLRPDVFGPRAPNAVSPSDPPPASAAS